MQLEVIAFDIGSCSLAERSGADRIELCANPAEGGTTPSCGMIRTARKNTSIQLYPIIRPRGGDFLYTEEEFRVMMQDVKLCRDLGCDGIVTGLLNADGTIDTDRTSHLTELAYPMGVTFHRAFDRVAHHQQALEDVIRCGCERILTSGLRPTAMEGLETLKALVELAGDRIIIMPGSGIRSGNLQQVAAFTGATEFHASARKFNPSLMEFSNNAMAENLQQVSLDEVEVRQMKQVLLQCTGGS